MQPRKFDGSPADVNQFKETFSQILSTDGQKKRNARQLWEDVNKILNAIDLELRKNVSPNQETIKKLQDRLDTMKPYVQAMQDTLAKQNPNLRFGAINFLQDKVKRLDGQLGIAKRVLDSPKSMQRIMDHANKEFKKEHQSDRPHNPIRMRRG